MSNHDKCNEKGTFVTKEIKNYCIPSGETPKSVLNIILYHIENCLYECKKVKGKTTKLGWTTSQQRLFKT